jgi:hypothetical protein
MKRLLALAATAALALAPALGSACDYATEAMATAPEQLAKAPEPAATKVPTSATAKAPVFKNTAKQVVVKNKEPAPDAKVVVVSTN